MTSRYTGNLVQYLYFELWDVLLFMFIGMAFFKLGILTGESPTRIYIWLSRYWFNPRFIPYE